MREPVKDQLLMKTARSTNANALEKVAAKLQAKRAAMRSAVCAERVHPKHGLRSAFG